MFAKKTHANDLVDAIGEFFYDPLGFVYFVFPWGEGQLKDQTGPDDWQVDVLQAVTDGTITAEEAIQIAVSSGHGIGKGALTAWLVLWFMSTRPNPQVVVTANTETQLTTKTWRELAKWHKLAINRDWFMWTATKFYHVSAPDTWFAAAIPWSINKAEAFAGTHEKDVLVIFDEASAIENIIWETTEGAMTTKGAMWLVFGNPTRNTGRFRECFGKFAHRWKKFQIDSRTCKMADQKQIKKWLQDYGEDSDFIRMRVRGVFPKASSSQFISSEFTENCRRYKAEGYESLPVIIGVDVARYGDDQTVITVRQGRKVFPQHKFRGLSTVQTAFRAAEIARTVKADAIFVDGVGVGGGVVDILKKTEFEDIVFEVTAGGEADDKKQFFNKRAEDWSRMKEFLKQGAEIPDDPELIEQINCVEYGYTGKEQIQLEKTEDIKARGLASPDCAASLAMTFSMSVSPRKRNPHLKKKESESWLEA